MGYLKHLSPEPLKELQAILRSNDTAKETALLQAGENNPEALDDLRNYLHLCWRSDTRFGLTDGPMMRSYYCWLVSGLLIS